MVYIERSNKEVSELVELIENRVSDFKFGVLHIHNVKNTLESKGVEFENECQILDICNPNYAKLFLGEDMAMSVIMPCKISVYKDNNETFIAMNSLVKLVDDLNPKMVNIAQEVEDTLLKLIDTVK